MKGIGLTATTDAKYSTTTQQNSQSYFAFVITRKGSLHGHESTRTMQYEKETIDVGARKRINIDYMLFSQPEFICELGDPWEWVGRRQKMPVDCTEHTCNANALHTPRTQQLL